MDGACACPDYWRSGIGKQGEARVDSEAAVAFGVCEPPEAGRCSSMGKIVASYADGGIGVDGLVTHTMPLEDIDGAFGLMHAPRRVCTQRRAFQRGDCDRSPHHHKRTSVLRRRRELSPTPLGGLRGADALRGLHAAGEPGARDNLCRRLGG